MKIDELATDASILQEFGNRLRQVRKQQGKSQIELAEQAGIGVATLRRIEDGSDAQLGSWIKLLKAMGQTSGLNQLLPENFRSPRAEATASQKGRRKKESHADSRFIWGDELP